MTPAATAQDERGVDPVVFRYKGQQFTAADLTMVSYDDYRRHLKDAIQIYNSTEHRPPNAGMGPTSAPWKTDTPENLEAFYKHEINGAIQLFVAHEVLLAVRKRPSNKIVGRYYDGTAIDAYVRQRAEVEQNEWDADMAAADHAVDLKTFITLAQARFPTDWGEAAYSQIYTYLKKSRPYCHLVHTCIPLIKGGRVAPWTQWKLETPLLRYHVQAELEQSKQQYVDLLERRFGANLGKNHSTSPPSFLFDAAEDAILRPIFAEVVKSMELTNGYSLPTVDELKRHARGSGIATERFGRPMPRVVLANDGNASR
jgi:hypothetical protein